MDKNAMAKIACGKMPLVNINIPAEQSTCTHTDPTRIDQAHGIEDSINYLADHDFKAQLTALLSFGRIKRSIIDQSGSNTLLNRFDSCVGRTIAPTSRGNQRLAL